MNDYCGLTFSILTLQIKRMSAVESLKHCRHISSPGGELWCVRQTSSTVQCYYHARSIHCLMKELKESRLTERKFIVTDS